MAIQMRRGAFADFDPSKMLPGEWAVSTDTATNKQAVWICFQTGNCKRIATFDDIGGGIAVATLSKAGIVKPDGTSISITSDGTISAIGGVDASYVQKGVVKVDKMGGLLVNGGTLSLGVADVGILGGVMPDGSTIVIDDNGTIHAVGSSGSTVVVTPVQTSGTELAKVTVDGVSTSIYAPSGLSLDNKIDRTSMNGVTNNGIATALQNTIGWYQNNSSVKNLINPTFTSGTYGGVTVTKNVDNSITLNGKCTQSTDIILNADMGDLSTPFWMMLSDSSRCFSVMVVDFFHNGERQYSSSPNVSSICEVSKFATKSSMSKETGYSVDSLSVCAFLQLFSGTTYNNVTLYPMISYTKLTDISQYVPYSEDITTTKTPIQEQIDNLFKDGSEGQFAVSDGNGGITWTTLASARSEVF